ncbi:MAG TPA: OmpH family outer membrane protein [Allosphingosinicella sp.]|nr:OmpH family outer membrane protein [Allosphingosinicella sp.]
MKRILFGAAIAALLLGLPGAALVQRPPGAVIVVVDMGRISRECTACRFAAAQVQAMESSNQRRTQQLQQSLQPELRSLESAAAALDEQPVGAGRTQQETALNTRYIRYQARQTHAQQEMAQMEQTIQPVRANVARQINERLRPVVHSVTHTHGANLAVSTDAALSFYRSLEVTDEVLSRLNDAMPHVSLLPPRQQTRPQGR